MDGKERSSVHEFKGAEKRGGPRGSPDVHEGTSEFFNL